MSGPTAFKHLQRLLSIALLGSALGGCAVIELSSDKGCASYLVLGVGAGVSHLLADAAVVHGRVRAHGAYVHQGASTRVGVGLMEERWVLVDPARADVLVNAKTNADGAYEVLIQSFNAKERSDETGVLNEVRCQFDRPAGHARRLR